MHSEQLLADINAFERDIREEYKKRPGQSLTEDNLLKGKIVA